APSGPPSTRLPAPRRRRLLASSRGCGEARSSAIPKRFLRVAAAVPRRLLVSLFARSDGERHGLAEQRLQENAIEAGSHDPRPPIAVRRGQRQDDKQREAGVLEVRQQRHVEPIRGRGERRRVEAENLPHIKDDAEAYGPGLKVTA